MTLKISRVIALILFLSWPFMNPGFGQDASLTPLQQSALENEGHFSNDYRGQGLSLNMNGEALTKMLFLKPGNELKEFHRQTDHIGYTHITYKQYFNQKEVLDGQVIVHGKDGKITVINGYLMSLSSDFTLPLHIISENEATQKALSALKVVDLIQSYPGKQVIMKQNQQPVLAWEVRVEGKDQGGLIQMKKVYINAETGDFIKSLNLIHDGHAINEGETIYRGIQTFFVDSTQEGFRLRDSIRKIHTFNAGGVQTNDTRFPQPGASPFERDVDYYNANTHWGEIKTIDGFSFDTAANANFLSGATLALTAIGQGRIVVDIDSGDYLTTNLLFPMPTRLPITENGLQIEASHDSLYGLIATLNITNFQTFEIEVVNYVTFPISDTSIGVHTWSDTAGNKGTYTIAMGKNPALDAHWGMEKTHDFYLDQLNRDSYDDNGGLVRNYVNGIMAYSGTQNNAAALPDPYNSMVYGLGDGVTMKAVVGLDVMGHEFSHMVTSHNGRGGINYENESGALNESFSDMLGTAIEFYTDSANANWTIGENVMLAAPGYFRSLSAPKGPASISNAFNRQPDTYMGTYWYTGTQDNGGVHINSGVPNKWFYLLSEGGQGINDRNNQYNVTAIGIEKATQIIYRTVMLYLTPNATIETAYNSSKAAATDLFGPNAPELQSVIDAWFAVGVPYHDSTGIASISSNNPHLSAYPNPSKGLVTLISDATRPFHLNVYSLTGAKVAETMVKTGSQQLDLSHLSKGTYFLNYQMNGQNYSEKLSIY